MDSWTGPIGLDLVDMAFDRSTLCGPFVSIEPKRGQQRLFVRTQLIKSSRLLYKSCSSPKQSFLKQEEERDHLNDNSTITFSAILRNFNFVEAILHGGNCLRSLFFFFFPDSSGTTLMDLITSDGSSSKPPSASSTTAPPPIDSAAMTAGPPVPMVVDKKSKKGTLMQIQSDTISAAKAAFNPVRANIMTQKQKKKPVSYAQLARSIHELAATSDQLDQQCEDRTVLRYVYYYLARILSDSGSQGVSPGGGIPTPNWDALADIDAGGGVTRADVVPRVVERLTSESLNEDVEFHPRRLQALKALTYAPSSNSEILSKLYEIVFSILDKVGEPQKRKKGIFGNKGGDKEELEWELVYIFVKQKMLHERKKVSSACRGLTTSIVSFVEGGGVFAPEQGRVKGFVVLSFRTELSIIRSNLQYAAISALRRLPLDPGNPAFLHRAVQGFYKSGALQDVLHLNDVLARVALAKLCHTVSRARALDERPDVKSQFNSVLYQLLLDPSERVCFEAILCVLGKFDNSERTEERAAGWYRLSREILKLPDSPSVKDLTSEEKDIVQPKGKKDKSSKIRRPQPLIKLVMRRLESSFRSFSRPVLHAAARVVQEMGKSRAASFALGQYIDEGLEINAFSENNDSYDADVNPTAPSEDSVRGGSALGNCLARFWITGSYTRAIVFVEFRQCLVGWVQRTQLRSLLASLMEVVRTTVACECVYVRAMVIKALIWMQSPHESFDELESIIASELSDPSWPATLLNDILLTLHARFKATPDMAVTLLEIARIFATKVPGKIDADVLQLLWKTCLVGAGPDGKHTALEAVTIVLDLPPPQPGSILGLTSIDKVSASDPKSALALQRLVQAAVWFLGENANYAASEYAWESATPPGTALMMLDADKMVAAASSRNPTLAGALTRLQRCAFSGSWEIRIIAAQALTTMAIRSGEPYRLQIYEFLHTLAQGGVQSQFSDMHTSNGEDQGASGTGLGSLISPMLKVLDEMYSAQDELINASTGLSDPAVATGISDLIYETSKTRVPDLIYETTKTKSPEPDALDDDLVNFWASSLGDDGAPAMNRVNEFLAGAGTDAPDVEEENIISRPSMSYDDMWAKTLLETTEMEEYDARSSGSSSPDSIGSVETSISSHFGGMNYPSLFSSKPSTYGSSQPKIREEPPPYSSPEHQRYESFENPLAGPGSNSYDERRPSSGAPQFGTALYDFTAGGDDELNLMAGEELEIEDEVDGWFYAAMVARDGPFLKIPGRIRAAIFLRPRFSQPNPAHGP
ncbi:hypothetical protein DH2020_039619 [Rehmannia glutinosa]|uniref:SH3 domain-containing protein n=1 Tax=Rehmannia glutinosa TaxID=99300 RepID=A0ABR0UW28_REHGL